MTEHASPSPPPLPSQYVIKAECSPRFLAQWFLFIFLLAGPLGFAVNLIIPNYFESPDANFIRNLYIVKDNAAYLRSAPGPNRLFYLAGSSGLFNFDARLAEKKLGMPVINMATHAALTLDYLLTRSKRQLRPGDTVLLAPEHHIIFNPDQSTTNILWEYYSTYDKRHFLELPLREGVRRFYGHALNDYIQSVFRWDSYLRGNHFDGSGAYNTLELSPNGDFLGPVTRLQNFPASAAMPSAVPESARQIFRDYIAWAKSARVNVLLTFAAEGFYEGEESLQNESFRDLESFYATLGVPIISRAQDHVFPKAWYLDTVYHSNAAVRRVRTESLIKELSRHWGRPPVPARPAIYVLSSTSHVTANLNQFPGHQGVEFRIYDPAVYSHPAVINAEEIRARALAGEEVFLDPAAADATLPAIGLRASAAARESAELSAELHPQNDELAFLCSPGNVPWAKATLTGAQLPGLTPENADQPWVAIRDGIASPRILSSVTGQPASIVQRFSIELPAGGRIAFAAQLSAEPGVCSVRINGWNIPASSSAIAVIKFDKRTGAIAKKLNFDAPAIVTSELLKAEKNGSIRP